MWNNYWTFLDYLELRRRIEKHLARGTLLIAHMSVFLIAVTTMRITLPAYGYCIDCPPVPSYFIEPGAGLFMAIWSFVIVLHALVTFFRSGAWGSRRNRLIEQEMRERVQNDDSYLSDNPKDLFRLHGILEENISRRAGVVHSTTLFATFNALVWIIWALSTPATDSLPWQTIPIVGFVIFLPMLLFHMIISGSYERKLRKQMENLSEQRDEMPKQKRFAGDSHLRLTDDGELLMIEDEVETPKGKRR